jgi:hypothetical protein
MTMSKRKFSRATIMFFTLSLITLLLMGTVVLANNGVSNLKQHAIELFMPMDKYNQLPPEKQQIIDKSVQRVVDAHNGTVPQADKSQLALEEENKPKVDYKPYRLKSAIGGREVPPGVHDISVNNTWGGYVERQNIQVYAGAYWADETATTSTGVLFVWATNESDGTFTHFEKIFPTEPTTSLTILAEKDGILTLQDTQHTKLYFNVHTLKFEK